MERGFYSIGAMVVVFCDILGGRHFTYGAGFQLSVATCDTRTTNDLENESSN